MNALSRYSDDERAILDSIEKLHDHHQKSEFGEKSISHSQLETQKNILKNMK